MPLINCYRSLHCEVTQYVVDIFIFHPLKRGTTRDDTFLQLMLQYTRLISTKRLHKHAGVLVHLVPPVSCQQGQDTTWYLVPRDTLPQGRMSSPGLSCPTQFIFHLI